jgi:hypothetical protein
MAIVLTLAVPKLGSLSSDEIIAAQILVIVGLPTSVQDRRPHYESVVWVLYQAGRAPGFAGTVALSGSWPKLSVVSVRSCVGE